MIMAQAKYQMEKWVFFSKAIALVLIFNNLLPIRLIISQAGRKNQEGFLSGAEPVVEQFPSKKGQNKTRDQDD